jgi:anti-sigma factor RsiW
MKPCERVDNLLSAYLENETSTAETRFVDNHVSQCARCRPQLGELTTLLTQLSDLPKVRTREGFTAKVLARTAGLAPVGMEVPEVVVLPSRRPAWVVPLAAAAAFAIVALGIVQAQREWGSQNEIAQIEPATNLSPLEGVAADAPGAEEETGPIEVPEILSLGPDDGKSLGMARDAYVLEAFELREPAGGGDPILTRVSADENKKAFS